MSFEYYIHKGEQKLRYGYTTGCCAALATKCAVTMLLSQKEHSETGLTTPKGLYVFTKAYDCCFDEKKATATVIKDAGDDIDATDKMRITATVFKKAEKGIVIDGGTGIGRVTQKGLEQAVGEAAINKTPREMIEKEALAVCEQCNYQGGINVIISAIDGEEIAKKTFNQQMGIQGGISILGTSGIVEPQSLQALLDTIRAEIKMHSIRGAKTLIIFPGNYGEKFIKEHLLGSSIPMIKCSNFIGDTLDIALEHGFEKIHIIGHIGKMIKLSAGVMNTHSKYADARREVFITHTALLGGSTKLCNELMQSVTSERCIELLKEENLLENVLNSAFNNALLHLQRRAGKSLKVECLMFSNTYGMLIATNGAKELLGLYT